MVGEGVSDVRGLIRGICVAISSVVTFRMIVAFGGKSCSGSNAGYKYN